MSAEPGVTRNDLRWWATAIVFPGIGLLITVVILGTQTLSKIETISKDLIKVTERQDRQDEKIDRINTKVDTIERRQEIYQATHK